MIRLLVFTVLVLNSFDVDACTLAPKPLIEYFNKAEKVFRGKIISSKKSPPHKEPTAIPEAFLPRTHTITILTNEVFKGNVELIETALTSEGPSCGIGLTGEDIVFFVLDNGYTGILSGSFSIGYKLFKDGSVADITGKEELLRLRELAN